MAAMQHYLKLILEEVVLIPPARLVTLATVILPATVM
jgi:hypothetical protein